MMTAAEIAIDLALCDGGIDDFDLLTDAELAALARDFIRDYATAASIDDLTAALIALRS